MARTRSAAAKAKAGAKPPVGKSAGNKEASEQESSDSTHGEPGAERNDAPPLEPKPANSGPVQQGFNINNFDISNRYPEIGSVGSGVMAYGMGAAFGWSLLPLTLYSLGASAITYVILKPILQLINNLNTVAESANTAIQAGTETVGKANVMVDDTNKMLAKLEKAIQKLIHNDDFSKDKQVDLEHLLADIQAAIKEGRDTINTLNKDTLPELGKTAKNVQSISQRAAGFLGGGMVLAPRPFPAFNDEEDEIEEEAASAAAAKRGGRKTGGRRR